MQKSTGQKAGFIALVRKSKVGFAVLKGEIMTNELKNRWAVRHPRVIIDNLTDILKGYYSSLNGYLSRTFLQFYFRRVHDPDLTTTCHTRWKNGLVGTRGWNYSSGDGNLKVNSFNIVWVFNRSIEAFPKNRPSFNGGTPLPIHKRCWLV